MFAVGFYARILDCVCSCCTVVGCIVLFLFLYEHQYTVVEVVVQRIWLHCLAECIVWRSVWGSVLGSISTVLFIFILSISHSFSLDMSVCCYLLMVSIVYILHPSTRTRTHTYVPLYVYVELYFSPLPSMYGNWIGFYGLCKTHIIQFNLTYCFERLMRMQTCRTALQSLYLFLCTHKFFWFCLSTSRCRSFCFLFFALLSLSHVVFSAFMLQQMEKLMEPATPAPSIRQQSSLLHDR